jgi:integrase
MQANTIRGIHSVLSGAFAAADRWGWIDRNPAEVVHPERDVEPKTPTDDAAAGT